ncbi:MAG TPA: response regulator, partial [Solirubrobacteraceae bacterium]|nr:response regulator [Solirubrobacteraceae bacterium]
MRSMWRCSSPGIRRRHEGARRARERGAARLAAGLAAGRRLEGGLDAGMAGRPSTCFDAPPLHPAFTWARTIRPSMSARDPRVLVVEDDDDIAQVLQRSLRMEGYDVRVAADGEAALSEAGRFHPDLVVLDLGLP